MDFNNLQLYKPKMEYRRFGKTNKNISVITLGGMRFQHVWKEPRNEVPQESIDELTDTVKKAFAQGINHIETAHGYTKSEHAFGIVLNDVLKKPRNEYYLMTKGSPKTGEDTRALVMSQLKALKTDYVDFYAYHGINDEKTFDTACKKGGPVEVLLQLKKEGIIKHLGFSTHGPIETIIKAIETDFFEFVNLHYYYFFQRNKGAIDLAETKDMGVFIISSSDKGGQLITPPEKLSKLTHPLTPIQWNSRFCLSNAAVHTLTFGLPVTTPFEQVNGIFPTAVPLASADEQIKHNLDGERLKVPFATFDGYCMQNDPSGINIPEIMRYRTMWKAYDMKGFGIYRYNTMNPGDHWLPGTLPTEENLAKIDFSKCPEGVPIVDLLEETHQALYKPKEKK